MPRSDRSPIRDDASAPKKQQARPSGAQTLERGLELLTRIVEEPVRMVDLTNESSLGKATVWRLVNILTNQGLVSINDRGELQGGVRLLQLAAMTQRRIDILVTARPWIDALAVKTGITAFLGRRDGADSIHLYRSASTQRLMVSTPAGMRRRLVETSLGKALLLDDAQDAWSSAFAAAGGDTDEAAFVAGMDENRRRDFVLNEGGAPDFINAIASPVRDVSGMIVAAISVASPAQYLGTSQMPVVAPAVLGTAASISEALGWDGQRRPR